MLPLALCTCSAEYIANKYFALTQWLGERWAVLCGVAMDDGLVPEERLVKSGQTEEYHWK